MNLFPQTHHVRNRPPEAAAVFKPWEDLYWKSEWTSGHYSNHPRRFLPGKTEPLQFMLTVESCVRAPQGALKESRSGNHCSSVLSGGSRSLPMTGNSDGAAAGLKSLQDAARHAGRTDAFLYWVHKIFMKANLKGVLP